MPVNSLPTRWASEMIASVPAATCTATVTM